MNTNSFQALAHKSFVFVGKKLTSKNAIAFYLSIALLFGLVIVAILAGLLMLVLLAIKPLVNHNNKHSKVKAEPKFLSQVETKNGSLIQPRIFIAPAVGRAVNPLHFLGYVPGGMGGGVNYYAFTDFRQWVEFDEKSEALFLTNEHLQTQLWTHYNDYELYCILPVLSKTKRLILNQLNRLNQKF